MTSSRLSAVLRTTSARSAFPLTRSCAPTLAFGLACSRNVAPPCGSRSHSSVRYLREALQARLTAAEVFPTPPLTLYAAMILTRLPDAVGPRRVYRHRGVWQAVDPDQRRGWSARVQRTRGQSRAKLSLSSRSRSTSIAWSRPSANPVRPSISGPAASSHSVCCATEESCRSPSRSVAPARASPHRCARLPRTGAVASAAYRARLARMRARCHSAAELPVVSRATALVSLRDAFRTSGGKALLAGSSAALVNRGSRAASTRSVSRRRCRAHETRHDL